jgi:hypothetical protein
MFGTQLKAAALAMFMALGLAATGIARAETLPVPKDKPILTISGKISAMNKEGTAQFDRSMLEAMGMVTVQTTTPWYEGAVKFEGVPLDKLMKSVGASGDRAVFVALNDYSTEIPMQDFAKYKVILALKRDGEYMPVRDKGPLFVIYPYDSDPELKSQTYYARSAWQVAKIIVR